MTIVYNWIKQPDSTMFDKFDPSFTFDDFLWPQIILNYNSRQNSESKHVYIWCFDQPVRFDPYWTNLTQFWPLTTINDLAKYKIWIRGKISSRNICIFDKFRLIRPIWLLFDYLTQVWPLLNFNRAWFKQIWNHKFKKSDLLRYMSSKLDHQVAI